MDQNIKNITWFAARRWNFLFLVMITLVLTISMNKQADAYTPLTNELILNGGFDEGVGIVKWISSGGTSSQDSSIKYEGTKAAKISVGIKPTPTTSPPISYLYTDPAGNKLTINPWKSYQLSMMVKTNDLGTGKFYVNILDFSNTGANLGWESYSVNGTTTTTDLLQVGSNSEWTKVSMYLPPLKTDGTGIHENTDSIVIYLRNSSSLGISSTSGSVWVDNVSLVEMEYIQNGGFESGVNPEWNIYGSTVSVDTTVKKHGSQSVKITGNSPNNTNTTNYINTNPDLSPKLEIDPSKSYDLTFWVKTDAIPTGGKFLVNILDFDAKNSNLGWEKYKIGSNITDELYTLTGTNATWTKVTIALNPWNSVESTGIHKGTKNIVIYLKLFTTTGTVWIDSVSLKARDTINVTVDANASGNESTGDDIAKLKKYVSQTGNDSGFTDLNDSVKGKLKDIGIASTRGVNFFCVPITCVNRDAAGKLTFDFTIAKNMVDNIIATGSKPHIIFGIHTPKVMSPNPDALYYYAYQPTDWVEYEEYIFQIMKFFNASNTYNIEYWEVGNEPDNSSTWYPLESLSNEYKYNKYWELYKHVANAVARYERDYTWAPRVKLGGPAVTVYSFNRNNGSPFNWVHKMLQDAANGNIRLDFVSWHAYNGAVGFGNIPQKEGTYPSLEEQVESVTVVRDSYGPTGVLNNGVKKYAEIIISEWGMNEDVSSVDGNVNGNEVGAAQLVRFMSSVVKINGIEKIHFLSSTDRTEFFTFIPNTIIYGPIPGSKTKWMWPSMFTQDMVIKAPYNAMKMIKMLAPTRVKATKDVEDHEVTVIASKDTSKITMLLSNNHYNYTLLKTDAVLRKVKINLKNVTSTGTTLQYVIYRIDEATSNAFGEYSHGVTKFTGNGGLQIVSKGTVTKDTITNNVVFPDLTMLPESTFFIELKLTSDNIAPTKPIVSPTPVSTTNSLSTVISGTAEVGARIEMFNNNLFAGVTYTNTLGQWYEEVKLSDGNNVIKFKAIDSHGNVSPDSTTYTVIKNANVLATPSITSDPTSTTTTYTLKGTVTVDTYLNIYYNSPEIKPYGRKVLVKELYVPTGSFSQDIVLVPGVNNSISVQSYDIYKNVSAVTFKDIFCNCSIPLLSNGTWDVDFAGWKTDFLNRQANLDTVTVDKGYSVRFLSDGSGSYMYFPSVVNKLPITASKTYQLTYKVKMTGRTSGGLYINVQDRKEIDPFGNPLGNESYFNGNVNSDRLAEQNADTTDFVTKTITLVPYVAGTTTGRKNGTGYILIYVRSDLNAGATAWIDSMVLTEM